MTTKAMFITSLASLFDFKVRTKKYKFKKIEFNLIYDLESDEIDSAWRDTSEEISNAFVSVLSDKLSKHHLNFVYSQNKFEKNNLNLSKNFEIENLINFCDENELLESCSKIEKTNHKRAKHLYER